MPEWIQQIGFGIITSVIIYSFKLFAPLAYGFTDASSETNSTMYNLRWMESWEF
jgi:dolichyl-phosphate-mannose-protein mannosyltransferase